MVTSLTCMTRMTWVTCVTRVTWVTRMTLNWDDWDDCFQFYYDDEST